MSGDSALSRNCENGAGHSGSRSLAGLKAPRLMLSNTSFVSLPPNGRRPTTASYRTTDSPHRSNDGAGCAAWMASGDMYTGVPITP